MKSFLVKPIEPAKLIQVVDAVLSNIDASNVPIETELQTSNIESESESWQAKMLASVGGDQETFRALADAFIIEVPQLCETLQSAIESSDAKQAQRAAHTLKSCLKYVAPKSDWQLAYEVEKAAGTDDMVRAKQLTPQAITIARSWNEKVSLLIETL